MCQIIQGPSAQIKQVLLNTEGLLEQLHKNNPDGWGALYHTTSGPKAIKKLPRSAADTRKLIEKLPSDDRSVALHWRWKTSGLVDQENAHPHFVDGGWLIHNGVLDIDMSANPDRCDTHHFARAYLDGSMPLLVQSPKMIALLGEFIGNNRFVLMDDAGTMAIVNAHQGYTAQGLWFANDYSMSRSLVDPTYKKKPVYSGFTSSQWSQGISKRDMWAGMDDGDDLYGASPLDRSMAYDEEDDDVFQVAECVDQAIYDQDNEELEALIEEFPMETLRHIADNYDVTEYENTNDEDLTPGVVAVRQALCRGDLLDLLERLEDDQAGIMPDRIATCLTWFCMAEPRPSTITTRLKELA